jgi:hypothetical protein
MKLAELVLLAVTLTYYLNIILIATLKKDIYNIEEIQRHPVFLYLIQETI